MFIKSISLTVLSTVYLAFICSIPIVSASEMRVWQSKKGSKITAELLYAGETLIMIKTDKGKEISTAIDTLVDADITYLKSLKKAEEKEEESEITKKLVTAEEKPLITAKNDPEVIKENDIYLDPLSEGKGKGSHAYYEGTKYIAKVTRSGALHVHFKGEDGKMDERWKMVIRAKSSQLLDDHWDDHKFEKFLRSNPPKMDATEVKYSFQSQTGINSEVIFEFNPEGFTTWTRSDEGVNTPENTHHFMMHYCGNMGLVNKDPDFLKKMKLKRKTVSGEKERYDYTDIVGIHGDTEECEISGPFFGKTKVTLERGKDEEAKFTPSQYPGSPLSDGFNMNTIKTDGKTKNHKNEKVTVTFK